jgi:hypothetical protein
VKKITSIGLVLLLCLQCFYNLGVLTYFQLNRDYIAEVLCVNKEKPITMCYGQCFLEKNLDLPVDAGDADALPVSKQLIDFPIFLVSENEYVFEAESPLNFANCLYLDGYSSKHLSPPFHPPSLLS